MKGSSARSAPATRVGPGFTAGVAAGGFSLPTDFAFLPPDRLLVSEKAGRVVQYDLRTRRRTVVLDLRERVDDTGFRGLVTVAVDTDFAYNQRIYVIYVLKPHTQTSETPTAVRLSSFRLRDGHAGHERILLGHQPRPCGNRFARTSDCYPAYVDHVGGQIAFAADGTVFVATGDGGGKPHASLALDPNSIAGKVLHINRNGNGLPANPFWNGNADANRSKVWALGLRNPSDSPSTPRTEHPSSGTSATTDSTRSTLPPRAPTSAGPASKAPSRSPTTPTAASAAPERSPPAARPPTCSWPSRTRKARKRSSAAPSLPTTTQKPSRTPTSTPAGCTAGSERSRSPTTTAQDHNSPSPPTFPAPSPSIQAPTAPSGSSASTPATSAASATAPADTAPSPGERHILETPDGMSDAEAVHDLIRRTWLGEHGWAQTSSGMVNLDHVVRIEAPGSPS